MKPEGTVQGPKYVQYVHQDEHSTYTDHNGNNTGLSLGCGEGSCLQMDWAEGPFAFRQQKFNQCNVNPATLASCAKPNYNMLTHDYVDSNGQLVRSEGANGFFTYESAYGKQCKDSDLKLNSEGRTILMKNNECGQDCGYYTSLTACNSNLCDTFKGTCGGNTCSDGTGSMPLEPTGNENRRPGGGGAGRPPSGLQHDHHPGPRHHHIQSEPYAGSNHHNQM